MRPIFCPDRATPARGLEPHRASPSLSDRGFTLVEVVLVVAVTGILVAVVAVFIKAPVEAYGSVVRRTELADQADAASRWVANEVRTALPNSLRVSVHDGVEYLEFIPTYLGARYRDVADGSTGDPLSFTSPSDLQFDLLGAGPELSRIRGGDFWVVYNIGAAAEAADAYRPCLSATVSCNRAPVQSAAAQGSSGVKLTLAFNPFARQEPPLPSPASRGHLIDQDQLAVTFACPSLASVPADPGPLTRHWAYGFHTTQPQPPSAGSSASVIHDGVACSFGYTAAVSGRTGLLAVTMRLTRDGESVTLLTQTLVDNTP